MKNDMIDIRDMSDSREFYEAKPPRAMIYLIYLIIFALLSAVVWMTFSKIDTVVKSSGMFRTDTKIITVGNEISGMVSELKVKDGDYVKKGQELCVIENDTISETLKQMKESYAQQKNRMKMLKAYQELLEGEDRKFLKLTENPYYKEFQNRKQLLDVTIQNQETEGSAQEAAYQKSIDLQVDTVAQNEMKISELQKLKAHIISRDLNYNADEYYKSILTSYISNYNLTKQQYDTQKKEIEKQIKEYKAEINDLPKLENTIIEAELQKETVVDETLQTETDILQLQTMETNPVMAGNTTESSKKKLEVLLQNANEKLHSLSLEQEKTLSNLEAQQVAAIEQLIENAKGAKESAEFGAASTRVQKEAVSNQTANNSGKKDALKLTEKGNVSREIQELQAAMKEAKDKINTYRTENGKCKIIAEQSGYFYCGEELKNGSFQQQGTSLGNIYPEKEGTCYAEVYVENQDIGKIKEGQNIKIEIAAYPQKEYGFLTGKVKSIPKDITVDQKSGSAYYKVLVLCTKSKLYNRQGQEAAVKNGMACQVKFITGEENVLQYILKKLDFM